MWSSWLRNLHKTTSLTSDQFWGKEVVDVAKNPKQTGKAAASSASKTLSSPSATKAAKSAAASALSQAPLKKK
jgi:hypothetical protein